MKTAEAIYRECLIRRGIISEHADMSYTLTDEHDAVIDAMEYYAQQSTKEITDERGIITLFAKQSIEEYLQERMREELIKFAKWFVTYKADDHSTKVWDDIDEYLKQKPSEEGKG